MKIVYQCDHCAFTHELKGMVSHHEGVCIKNPSVKTCFTCEHHCEVLKGAGDDNYICKQFLAPHFRIDCEDGVVHCQQYADKR